MLEEHTGHLRNLYRKNQPAAEAQPGNTMINLALANMPLGDPVNRPGVSGGSDP